MQWILFQVLLVTALGCVVLLIRRVGGKWLFPWAMTLLWTLFFICALFPVGILKQVSIYPEQKEVVRRNGAEYERWVSYEIDCSKNLIAQKQEEKSLETQIVIIWGIGIFCSLTYHLIARLKMRKKVQSFSCRDLKEKLLPEMEKIWIPVKMTEKFGPAVFGILPTVYIPEELLEEKDALRSILLHEQAHVERKHPAVLVLMDVVGSLYWFLPYVYLLFFAALREDMEYCCDYEVIQKYGINPKAYAMHYVNVAAYRKLEGNELGFRNVGLKRVDYMLHIAKSMKYSVLAVVLGMIILAGVGIGINVYYQRPDENGHSLAEVEKAKDVVMHYVSSLEIGDKEGMLNSLVADTALFNSVDYDIEWSRFVVHNLRYEPDSISYYYQHNLMNQENFQPQNWILLIMDCDLSTRYDTHTIVTGWTLVQEAETKLWKIYDFNIF